MMSESINVICDEVWPDLARKKRGIWLDGFSSRFFMKNRPFLRYQLNIVFASFDTHEIKKIT